MKICRREHVGRALERLMSATNTKAPTGGNGENRDLPSGPCFLLLNLYGGDFNQFIDAMRIGAPEGQRDNSPGQMSGASAALGADAPKFFSLSSRGGRRGPGRGGPSSPMLLGRSRLVGSCHPCASNRGRQFIP